MNEYDILRFEISHRYHAELELKVYSLHARHIAALSQGDWEIACELERTRDRVHQKLLEQRNRSVSIVDWLELDSYLRKSKKTYPDCYEDIGVKVETDSEF
ncbi:MAG: hypothetical protein N4J56_006485 [Chroococcidiopsis sp. SAG 2025]|uniref:hypothetical protein n=1 Tax=Chroococcidiopsis sp. SAG 2025 TaxID=171389 RepID=UPI002937460E|nr:hypothetical protein [Chroococcidiopsis sp. SAG 2025]MDV2996780.1 hypothetical protein [Chroococcidiopsis sp. SAG 2025]